MDGHLIVVYLYIMLRIDMRGNVLTVSLCLIGVCALFSCTERHTRVADFQEVSRYMDTSPDSALLLLEAIEEPDRLSQEQYAMYCLLTTEAKDKTYKPHLSDSLISVATRYFDVHNDDVAKAKSWYYAGRVNQELLQAEKAIECYLKAIPYAELTSQYRLLALIYSHTSNLYRQQKMFDNALASARKSYDNCLLTKDTVSIAFSLKEIGGVYLFMNQRDQTLDYYYQALALAKEYRNADLQMSILNDLGLAYEQAGNFAEALRVTYEAMALTVDDEDRYTHYLSLGNLYLQMHQADSAKYYLEAADRSSNAYIKGGASYYLYLLSKDEQVYQDALRYYEYYQEKKRQTEQTEQKEEILKLTHQYEQRELKKEMELRTVRERFFYSCCILFLLIVLTVGYFLYMKYRWSRERLLRLKEKQIQYEKELRLMSEEQIRHNREQIEVNRQKLVNKEEVLQSVQRNLLNYNTKLLKAENDLIALRREEYAFRNKLFEQTGISERIRIAGTDSRKVDSVYKPFTSRSFPELIRTLNEIYNGFANRLQQTYPQLKERDLEICYLLKGGAKTGNIADVIAMTPNAVTKKKRQILDKMEIIDGNASLEDFLTAF